MKTNFIDRTWISPFVTVAFCVIGATGVLLFFHIKNGVLMTLHEWFGWGFVIGGALHLVLNWRPLASYLRRRSALVALAVSIVMVGGLAYAGASKPQRGGGGGRPITAAMLLDADGNGVVDASEVEGASARLKKLDKNGDGQLSPDELQPQRSIEGGRQH